jgi:predicted alpha/beta superfamily hydrolase
MKKIGFFFIFLLGTLSLCAQITFTITSVPSNTPQDDDIYLAGNFNGWDAQDVSYIFTNNGNGTYSITFTPEVGELLFKFTRGGWETVEGSENGGFVPDRQYIYNGGVMNENYTIAGWEDLDGTGGDNSTAADNVYLLDEDFYMPQLSRNRRIWIYLPPDYNSTAKNYPVLYMHDAQNIFDAATSFSGEWEVDETLNALHANGDYGCIVVGIENGGAARLDEYSPWFNTTHQAGGEGDEYVEFIVNDLKPYVDANYRTFSGRNYTGIMGSSMGGLISHYAGIAYQDVFGRVGAFSCSFWFSDESYTQVGNEGDQSDMRIYYLVGQGEGESMVDDTEGMYSLMLANGFSENELVKDVDADGQHSEWYWRREFAGAYQWLFGSTDFTAAENKKLPKIRLFPNPTSGQIFVENFDKVRKGEVQIYALNGQLVYRQNLAERININSLNRGVYLVKISSGGRTVFADKVAVE